MSNNRGKVPPMTPKTLTIYQHFAVIHVRLPESKRIHDVEIELNEFQVQMAIDNLQVYKLGEKLTEDMTVEQKEDNEVV